MFRFVKLTEKGKKAMVKFVSENIDENTVSWNNNMELFDGIEDYLTFIANSREVKKEFSVSFYDTDLGNKSMPNKIFYFNKNMYKIYEL